MKDKRPPFIDILLTPKAIFAGIAAGGAIGIMSKGLSAQISFFGDLFLAFLMMCTLPVVITAVIGGLGRMFHLPDMAREIKKLVAIFLLCFFFAAGIAYLVTIWISPGDLISNEDKETMGQQVLSEEKIMDMDDPHGKQKSSTIFLKIIPSNVFSAMSRGQILSVLFFSIFLGASIGLLRSKTSEGILNIMDSIFNACQQIISWAMYALPFALCSFMADQVSKVGLKIILAMGGFILAAHIASILVIIVNGFVLSRASGVSFIGGFRALREALVIAFCTSNSLAAIPSALKGLQEKLNLDHDRTNLIVPFGITMCNPSAIIYFVVVSIFFAQVNNVSPVYDNAWLIIIFGSIAASLGTAGGGAAVYCLLIVIFDPLGLPVKNAIPILLAVDRLIYPILTTADVHMNCAIASIMSGKQKKI